MRNDDLDAFLRVSRAITGARVEDLSSELAAQYLDRLREAFPDLGMLVRELASAPADSMVDAAKEDPRVRAIASIWYTSEFRVPGENRARTGTQQQFYAGLLWKVLGARAPSNSPGPYGYWSKRP